MAVSKELLLIIKNLNFEFIIQSKVVFDRWGYVVFAARNFPPNDPAFAWDGKRNGVEMNPAVFAYRMMAKFKDGRREVRNGDVTLVR